MLTSKCFFTPATTAKDLRLRRIFYPRFYPLHLFSYLNSWERASIFPLPLPGTILITSLVWRGPGLTGDWTRDLRTRSQHYSTRLSRRRCRENETDLSKELVMFLCFIISLLSLDKLYLGRLILRTDLIFTYLSSRKLISETFILTICYEIQNPKQKKEYGLSLWI